MLYEIGQFTDALQKSALETGSSGISRYQPSAARRRVCTSCWSVMLPRYDWVSEARKKEEEEEEEEEEEAEEKESEVEEGGGGGGGRRKKMTKKKG